MHKLESISLNSAREVLRKQLVSVRILGHLLAVGPTDTARAHIALKIISCKNNETLIRQGDFYDKHFIRTFRKVKGATPVPSRHQSRPSFSTTQDSIKSLLIRYPQNHQQAKSSALIRDSFRCVLSGVVDMSSILNNDQLGEEVAALSQASLETQCSHIFSESTNKDLDNDAKREYAANTWAIIQCFGFSEIRGELEGAKVHLLRNVFTLEVSLHTLFNVLKLWFEPTDIPNRYKVGTSEPRLVFVIKKLPEFIEFKSAQPNLELPSEKYLRIHGVLPSSTHVWGCGVSR